MSKKKSSANAVKGIKESGIDLSKVALCILIAFAAIAIFLVANNFAKGGNEYQGTEQKTDAGIVLEFTCLDELKSQQIQVAEGDKLHCSFKVTEGVVDVTITCAGEKVYNGGKVETSEFDVVIEKAGTAVISVQGVNAAGKISVLKA